MPVTVLSVGDDGLTLSDADEVILDVALRRAPDLVVLAAPRQRRRARAPPRRLAVVAGEVPRRRDPARRGRAPLRPGAVRRGDPVRQRGRPGSRWSTTRASRSASTSPAGWRRPSTPAASEHVAPLLDAIEEVLGALAEAGIEAFPAYGTLLGAVREQHLIGHDSDADLGYVSRHEHPFDVVRESFRLQRRLAERGYTITRYSGIAFKVDVVEGDGSVRGLDVFGGFLSHGNLYLMGEVGTPVRGVAGSSRSAPARSRAARCPAPAEPDRMLEAMYGPGWKVPDPAFHFETSRQTVRRLNGWFRGTRVFRDEWERQLQHPPRQAAATSRRRRSRSTSWRRRGCRHGWSTSAPGAAATPSGSPEQGSSVTAYDYVPTASRAVQRRARAPAARPRRTTAEPARVALHLRRGCPAGAPARAAHAGRPPRRRRHHALRPRLAVAAGLDGAAGRRPALRRTSGSAVARTVELQRAVRPADGRARSSRRTAPISCTPRPSRRPERPDAGSAGWWRNGGRERTAQGRGPARARPQRRSATCSSGSPTSRTRSRSCASRTSGSPRSPTWSRSCWCRSPRATRRRSTPPSRAFSKSL